MYTWFIIQTTGEIESYFTSRIIEPRLVVFHDESNKIQQVFLCAETKDILEVTTFVEGLILLMSPYYVYNVQYPCMCKATLYFLQDIVMGRPETSGPAKARPTRYNVFLAKVDL